MAICSGSLLRVTITLTILLIFLSTSTASHDQGNITIKWDVVLWTADGYVASVTMFNHQLYRGIKTPGWTLGWTWAKKELIWSMIGGQTTEQGDCSRFKGNIPHCCKKDPTVVDLLPGTPYNQQIANCCKGGVLKPNDSSSFQLSVGSSGTTNKTVRVPRNFTLKAPGSGRYACGQARIVRPTRFITQDGRVTQAMTKLPKSSKSSR